jgi:hypothetical protein
MVVICSSSEAETWTLTLLWLPYACNSKQTVVGKHVRSYLQCGLGLHATFRQTSKLSGIAELIIGIFDRKNARNHLQQANVPRQAGFETLGANQLHEVMYACKTHPGFMQQSQSVNTLSSRMPRCKHMVESLRTLVSCLVDATVLR